MVQQHSKKQISIALKKAVTSIAKIQKMLDKDKYCIDILQQILAVQGLLKASSEKILTGHLHSCFADGMVTNDLEQKEKLVNELTKVMKLNAKF